MVRTKHRGQELQFAVVELGGVRYAMVPEAVLVAVCRRAGVSATVKGAEPPSSLDAAPGELDGARVARRIADRRKQAGLTQAELARRAGVRVETVNRIERGHVTPDFGTIRKLVQAMFEAEGAAVGVSGASRKPKE
jgi:DNA-binding XRE family transcriptional regulator